MLRDVIGTKVDLTDTEFSYFNEMVQSFGPEVFKKLITTDGNGRILSVTPSIEEPTAMVVLFFVMNVMLNQRLRSIDKIVDRHSLLEKRVKSIEKRFSR